MLLWFVAAFIWGAAEAILFFIVADVLLTFMVLRHGPKPALLAACCATVGALVGGAALYIWSGNDAATVRDMLDLIPATSPRMIDTASSDMAAAPATTMLSGAFSGVPYKLFAAAAPHAGVALMPFLAWTVPARLARYMLLIFVFAAIAAGAGLIMSRRRQMQLALGGWVLFYALFWSLMPN